MTWKSDEDTELKLLKCGEHLVGCCLCKLQAPGQVGGHRRISTLGPLMVNCVRCGLKLFVCFRTTSSSIAVKKLSKLAFFAELDFEKN